MNCNVMNCNNESNNELKITVKIYQFDSLSSIIFDSTIAILSEEY